MQEEVAVAEAVKNPGLWARVIIALGRVASAMFVKNPKSAEKINAGIDIAAEIVEGSLKEAPPK